MQLKERPWGFAYLINRIFQTLLNFFTAIQMLVNVFVWFFLKYQSFQIIQSQSKNDIKRRECNSNTYVKSFRSKRLLTKEIRNTFTCQKKVVSPFSSCFLSLLVWSLFWSIPPIWICLQNRALVAYIFTVKT